MPGMAGHGHMLLRVPDHKHSCDVIRSITAWHSHSIIGTHIINMIAMASGRTSPDRGRHPRKRLSPLRAGLSI
jgi:hypothetical protein